MPSASDIYKAAGIIISDRRLLVTKSYNKDSYVSPGGKLEIGESPVQALIRELNEELHLRVSAEDLKPFGSFSAPAAGQEYRLVHMDVFIVSSWTGDIQPGREIEQLMWLSSRIPAGLKVGSIFEHEVIPRLKSLNLID